MGSITLFLKKALFPLALFDKICQIFTKNYNSNQVSKMIAKSLNIINYIINFSEESI